MLKQFFPPTIRIKPFTCLFVCLAFTLPFIFTQHTTSQQINAQHPLTKLAIAKCGPLGNLSWSELRRLELSEEQEATVLGIIQEANEWFETDRYLELLKNDPDGILEERNADLFKRFEQCLNKSQVKLVRQRVSAFYFTRESKRQLLVMDEGEYLYGTPPWMEKSIAAHIGLEQKSFDKAVSILKSFRKDRVNLYKTHRKNLVSFFAAWNNELQNELGPAQQKKYKSAMGKPIKFPESCESVFDLASAGGPLIFRQQSVNIKVSFTPTSDLFLLAKLESKFNGKYVPEGLLEFLKLPEISSNLELSKEQLSKISEIQKSWREEYPAEKTCLIDNNFGTEPPSAICPEEKTPKMTQLEKLQKRIDNVLTKIQEKRLRQIWNQVVVQFGWKEVPLVHPDWIRFLNLDETTEEQFEKINKKRRAEYRRIVKQAKEAERLLEENLPKQLSDVLSEKEKAAAVELFGIHYNGLRW